MAARNENLRKLERMGVVLVDYHRWLAEFPIVCRVLENLFIELEGRPMQHADVTAYRSVSHLRDELRAIAATRGVRGPDAAEVDQGVANVYAVMGWKQETASGVAPTCGKTVPRRDADGEKKED